jgi:hypothetical protein
MISEHGLARRAFLLAGTLAWLTAAAAPVAAQPDLPALLVGRWEGQITGISSGDLGPNRALVIKSVEQKDGKWVAAANWGVPGKGMPSTEVSVQVIDGTPILDFMSGGVRGGAKVSLRLDGKILKGTSRFTGAPRDGDVRLERVSTTP